MAISTGSYLPLVEQLTKQLEHVKYPSIRLPFNDTEIICKLIGSGSAKWEGGVNVKGPGNYESAVWFGRITKTGFWHRGHVPAATGVHVTETLSAFINDPRAIAKVYGTRYGNCCFCGKELTHPASLFAGYGPVCADRWGLPWGDEGDANDAISKLVNQDPLLKMSQAEVAAAAAKEVTPPPHQHAPTTFEAGEFVTSSERIQHVIRRTLDDWLSSDSDDRTVERLASDIAEEIEHS